MKKTLAMTAFTLIVGTALLLPHAWGQGAAKGKPTARPVFGKDIREIFFSDAREKLGAGAPPGGVIVPGSKSATPMPAPMPTPTETPAAGAGGWAQVIPAENIESEIKALTTAVAAETKAAGPFKGAGYKKARVQLTMLSILFSVIQQYDGDVRWKKDAAGMRDALAKAANDCKTGDQYAGVKLQTDSVGELVRGSQIDVAEGKPNVGWATIADIGPVMVRLDLAQRERLKPWLSSEAEFKANKDKVLHEAALLAVLAEVIQDKGYDAAGETDYLGWAKVLKASAIEIKEACEQDQFTKASAAITKVTKACADCHAAYRGN